MNRTGMFANRRGTSMAEVLIASMLLIVATSALGQGIIGAGRIWQSERKYALALDEVTNQMERLLALDAQRRGEELERLEISSGMQSTLSPATLGGEIINDELGTRLHLKLQLQDTAGLKPVELVGWIELPNELADDSRDSDSVYRAPDVERTSIATDDTTTHLSRRKSP